MLNFAICFKRLLFCSLQKPQKTTRDYPSARQSAHPTSLCVSSYEILCDFAWVLFNSGFLFVDDDDDPRQLESPSS
jgi:hypothetical protein